MAAFAARRVVAHHTRKPGSETRGKDEADTIMETVADRPIGNGLYYTFNSASCASKGQHRSR